MTGLGLIIVAEAELNRLLRNYRLREPQEDIVRHALRAEFAERFPVLANNYELHFGRYWIPGNAARPVDTAHLRFRSAVDRLAGLARG